MNIFQRILSWLVPDALYLFKCFVCGVIYTATLVTAKALGWQNVAGSGWRCPVCSGGDKL